MIPWNKILSHLFPEMITDNTLWKHNYSFSRLKVHGAFFNFCKLVWVKMSSSDLIENCLNSSDYRMLHNFNFGSSFYMFFSSYFSTICTNTSVMCFANDISFCAFWSYTISVPKNF